MQGPTNPCPICSAREGLPVYAYARDPITLDSFAVLQCSKCGVTYTAPRPGSMDRYYPGHYRSYGPFIKYILGRLYDLRVSRWTRLKPRGGSALEIGCGPGLMLASFQRRGWRVLGIERSEAAAEAARRLLGVHMVTTSLEALPAEATFDLIIMFHVLEHIDEPLSLLRECAKRLAPGGHLIINVPNFASWQSRAAGSKWFHLDTPRHLIHFTPQTLAATLERAGLRLTGVRFVSLEHDPYGWVESAINRITGHPNTLSRFLMGIDPFGWTVLLSYALAAVLLLPALLLALASWLARSGALMEAVAVRAASAAE
jgi:SAM-dependent methyltransferase